MASRKKVPSSQPPLFDPSGHRPSAIPVVDVVIGNALDAVRELATRRPRSVQAIVTSPPYYQQRHYPGGVFAWPATTYVPLPGLDLRVDVPAMECQLGWEPTPAAYVGHLVAIFAQARAVLRGDGVALVNLGDGFDANKNLRSVPSLFAFAMRAAGWRLRAEIIWHKPNPMPSPVKDRPTASHEYVYLFAQEELYFWDGDAIRTPHKPESLARYERRSARAAPADAPPGSLAGRVGHGMGSAERLGDFMCPGGANARDVWTIPVQGRDATHDAVMPDALADRCILASTSNRGCCPACGAPWRRTGTSWAPCCACTASNPVPCTVLDPFAGRGTTGARAQELFRSSLLIESAAPYRELIDRTMGLSSTPSLIPFPSPPEEP